jgi:hypothetical protein
MLFLALLALTTGAAWRRGDGYVLQTENPHMMVNTGIALRELPAMQRRFGHGPYVWARVGGRNYLIRDEAFLRQAAALWAPVDALRPEQDALSAEESRLDKRIDAIEDHPTRAGRGELPELRERFRDVERRMRDLDQRSEALEKVAEERLRDLVDDAIRDGRAREVGGR